MLKSNEEIYCGIFDSGILRKNEAQSENRTVRFYELELFHADGGTSHIGTEAYPVRKGMLLCAKPGQVRHSEFPVRCSFIRVMPNAPTEIAKILDSMPKCTYIEDNTEEEKLMALFAKLGSCFISSVPTELNDLRINSLFLEILYRCAMLAGGYTDIPTDRPVGRLAREAYEYINEHYTENCSLAKISEALNVSPNYLHSLFLSKIGLTPFEYVTKKRIERAKRLIMSGELTMLEIALETGFCSQSHFNKVFKEQVGLTPVQYRKKLLRQY